MPPMHQVGRHCLTECLRGELKRRGPLPMSAHQQAQSLMITMMIIMITDVGSPTGTVLDEDDNHNDYDDIYIMMSVCLCVCNEK